MSSKALVISAASLLLSISSIGCSHPRDLKTVAASDFRCPSDQVVIHKGSKKNGRQVTGCGLSGQYRFREGEWVREDAWTMVTTTTPTPATTSPLAPTSAPATDATAPLSAVVTPGRR